MCVAAAVPAISAWFAGSGAAAAGSAAVAAAGTSAAATTSAVLAGTAASGGMTALQAASLASTLVGTGLSAYGMYSQAQTSKQIAKNNAVTAEYAAQDALRRGEKDVMELRRKGASLQSSQRAAMAAKGLDLGYGTSADLQDQTDFFTESDVATTRTNAAKEAWSRRSQGANYRNEANATNPLLSGGSTLLSGAGLVADKWHRYRTGGTY